MKQLCAWVVMLCMVISLPAGAIQVKAADIQADETGLPVVTEDAAEATAPGSLDAEAAEEPAEAPDAETAEEPEQAEESEDAVDSAEAEPVEEAARVEESDDGTGELMAVKQSFYVGTFKELQEAISRSNKSADGSFTDDYGNVYESITLENREHMIEVEEELTIEKTLTIDLALVSLVSKNAPGAAAKGTHRIFNVKGTLRLTASEGNAGIVGGNVSDGGAIYVDKGATLILQEYSYLQVTGGEAGNGGGIYVAGTLNMEKNSNSSISDNTATRGGGIYVADGAVLNLNGGSVISNIATEDGGGIYVANGATLNISGTAIGQRDKENSAKRGGGVYLAEGTVTLTAGSSIAFNLATDGAGIYINKGSFSVTNGRIGDNKADSNGGGVYFAGGSFELKSSKDGKGVVESNSAGLAGGGVYLGGRRGRRGRRGRQGRLYPERRRHSRKHHHRFYAVSQRTVYGLRRVRKGRKNLYPD